MLQYVRSITITTWTRIGATLALLGPLVYLGLRQFAYLSERSIPCCDYAALELGSRAFLSGEQLVGLYSRQGWRHPGPAPFLWEAPFRLLPGNSFAEHGIAIVVLAILAIGIALWFFSRKVATRAFLAAAVVLGFWMIRFDIRFFLEPWNPEMAMFWVLAFVPSLAMFHRDGSSRWLVALLATGTMATQSHLSAAPIVVIGLGVAGWDLWKRRKDRSLRNGMYIAVGVAFLLWLLPLIDLIVGERNLLHIFTANESNWNGSFDGGTMLRNLVQIMGLGPAQQGLRFGAASPFVGSGSLDVLQILLAVAGTALGIRLLLRRNQHQRLALAVGISFSGLLATSLLLAVSGGEYFAYVLLPVVSLGPIIWSCGLIAFVTDLKFLQSVKAGKVLVIFEIVALAAISTILVIQVPTASNADAYTTASLRDITDQILDNCDALPDPALLAASAETAWTDAIGIVAAVEQCTTVRAYGHLGFIAGQPYAWKVGDWPNLIVVPPKDIPEIGTVVAQNEDFAVVVLPIS